MANSKRKCKHCKEYSTDFISVPVGTFCTFDHAVLFANQARQKKADKARAKQLRDAKEKSKAERKQTREDKERLKTTGELRKEAQAAFNRYIRLSDFGKPCISCGKASAIIEKNQGWKHGGCWDAGHYQSRGAKGQLRFNVFNVNKQCKSCNGGERQSAGKAASVREGYREGLIEKYGIDKVVWLENNNEPEHRKTDREYLRRIKKTFNKRARFYEKRVEKCN